MEKKTDGGTDRQVQKHTNRFKDRQPDGQRDKQKKNGVNGEKGQRDRRLGINSFFH